MPARKQQTHAKRARELAVKEKRERKRAKKAEAAALRAGVPLGDESVGEHTPAPDEGEAPAILTEQESR
jgi:hypothetical protein